MTSLSRVTGLVRDIAFAQVLGSGLVADTFFVAFRIPNFLRRIFGEGAFSSAFVPVYSEFEARGGAAQATAFLDQMAGRLCLILITITIVGVAGAPILVMVLAPGFHGDPEKFQATVDALRFTFPYIFFISLVAMAAGILNTRDRFAVPAVTPVFLNLCLIATIFLIVPRLDNVPQALGIGVLLAGVVQLGFQIPFLHLERRIPVPRIRDVKSDDQAGVEGVKKVFRLMVPALFGVSVAQLNLLINTVLASTLVTGSVSWLYYSDRLVEFPLAIFGVALATVILPKLSVQYKNSSPIEFSKTLEWALRVTFILSVPASVGLAILAEHLMIVLFQSGSGQFSSRDATMAGRSLVAFSFGLLGMILVRVLAPGFFARKDTKTPVKAGIVAVIVNGIVSLVLIWPLGLGHVGLAYATSIAAFVNAALLYRWLILGKIYMPQKGWLLFICRIFLGAVVMGLVLGFLVDDPKSLLFDKNSSVFLINTYHEEAGIMRRVALVTQWVFLGCLIYVACLYATGIKCHVVFRRPDDS